ncbi:MULTISPECIES: hypothetical protein [Spongiibacter]|uniref:hypothetical protein n=1 Tax=Spongiibacter TaxID=630749 RepID=UPI002354E779|nr:MULTISPECIES: hypothetical protein [Spongiibacter]
MQRWRYCHNGGRHTMIEKCYAALVSLWQTITLPPLAPIPVRSDEKESSLSTPRNCHRSLYEDSEF